MKTKIVESFMEMLKRETIERQLEQPSGMFGGREDPKSLDYYDNKIDDGGQYALKYGVFDHD